MTRHIFVVAIDSVDVKQGADRDETPPRTPTGNAPSSESDIEVSSPSNDLVSSSNDIVVSQEEDERLAKELSLKEAAAHDLSHRPKRRRFHESYNFNMKCPTPGCNSLGECTDWHMFHGITSSSEHLLILFHSTPSTSSFGLSQVISQGGTRDISPYQDALSTTTSLPMNARYTHTQTEINMMIHQRGIQDKK